MSILIKGMDMPTSCRACLYSRTDIRNVDWCVLTEKDLPCECPIIPVPPHGRLIDADRLEAKWANCDHGVYYDKMNFVQSIQKAPTIIPAEEATT